MKANVQFTIDPMTTSFRALKSMVKSTSGQNLPSAKALRDNGGNILFVHENRDVKLTVYESGFFLYEDGDRATVSAIDRCRHIIYRYQNNEVRKVEEPEFRDGPCLIPLLMIGDERVFHSIDNYEWYWHEFSLNNDGDDWNIADSTESAEDAIVHKESTLYLQAKVKGLTKRQQQIITLYYDEGLTIRQISNLLHITISTVHEGLSSGIKQLRSRL